MRFQITNCKSQVLPQVSKENLGPWYGGVQNVWGEENVPENARSRKFLDPSKRASGLLSRGFLYRKNRGLTPEGGGKRTVRGGVQNHFLGGVSFVNTFPPPLFSVGSLGWPPMPWSSFPCRFWKTARKTTKTARISSACRTPKILGKEGKNAQNRKEFLEKEKGKEKQKGKEKKIRVAFSANRQELRNRGLKIESNVSCRGFPNHQDFIIAPWFFGARFWPDNVCAFWKSHLFGTLSLRVPAPPTEYKTPLKFWLSHTLQNTPQESSPETIFVRKKSEKPYENWGFS